MKVGLSNKQRGVSFIDVLVGTAIMILVFVGIFGVFQLSLVLITNSKARAGAVAISNGAVEYARSLKYADIGTVGGIPAGVIPQEEEIVLNGVTYTKRILVQYFDDAHDGLAGSDQNSITSDYKKIKAEVSWDDKGTTRTVSTVSNITPKGLETLSSGGTLTIDVTDASVSPVVNARVDIYNDSVNPIVDLSTFTNSSGRVSFPGTTVGSGYEITVSKTGYSTAETYDADSVNVNPNPGHLVVSDGETAFSTFQIDLFSTKTINTTNTSGSPIGNVGFNMRGNKTIGERADETPIYKYDEDLSTDGSGTVTINNLEWDSYTISIDGPTEGYDIAESCEFQPRSIDPAVSVTTNIKLATHTTNSLLVRVLDSEGENIASSTVRLFRTPGVDISQETSACGQTFFGALSEGTVEDSNPYSLDVSASGYQTENLTDVDVSGASNLQVVLVSS